MIDGFFGEYRFLSNFWFAPVEYEGIIYRSSEHAFQAAKTFLKEERLNIANLATPALAKKAGKLVTLRKDWEQVKADIMLEIVTKKFENPRLAQLLLDTGDEELMETNTWGDTYWGVCNGVGQNELGLILMEVRFNLRYGKKID